MKINLTNRVISELVKSNCLGYIDISNNIYKKISLFELKTKLVYTDLPTISIWGHNFESGDICFKLTSKILNINVPVHKDPETEICKFVVDIFLDMLDKSKHFSNVYSLFLNTVEIIENNSIEPNEPNNYILKIIYNVFIGFSEYVNLDLKVDFSDVLDGNETFIAKNDIFLFPPGDYLECNCGEYVGEDGCGLCYDEVETLRKEYYQYDNKNNLWVNGNGDVTYEYGDIPSNQSSYSYGLSYMISIYSSLEYSNQDESVVELNNWVYFYMLNNSIPYLTLNLKR